jgi:hypothetical protein
MSSLQPLCMAQTAAPSFPPLPPCIVHYPQATYRISPRVLFDLLSDPQQHDKIFDAIEVSAPAPHPEQPCVKKCTHVVRASFGP